MRIAHTLFHHLEIGPGYGDNSLPAKRVTRPCIEQESEIKRKILFPKPSSSIMRFARARFVLPSVDTSRSIVPARVAQSGPCRHARHSLQAPLGGCRADVCRGTRRAWYRAGRVRRGCWWACVLFQQRDLDDGRRQARAPASPQFLQRDQGTRKRLRIVGISASRLERGVGCTVGRSAALEELRAA